MNFVTGVIAATILIVGVAAPDVVIADENAKIFNGYKSEYCKNAFWKDEPQCLKATDFQNLKDVVQKSYTACEKKTKEAGQAYGVSDTQVELECGNLKQLRSLSIEAYFNGAKSNSCNQSAEVAKPGVPAAPATR